MLEEELGRMNPDMGAISAFQAKEAEYAKRVSDLEAATAERDNVSAYCCSPFAGLRGVLIQSPEVDGCNVSASCAFRLSYKHQNTHHRLW